MAVTLDALLRRTWFQEMLPEQGQSRQWVTAADIAQLSHEAVLQLIRAYAECVLEQWRYEPDAGSVQELSAGHSIDISHVAVSAAQLSTFLNALSLAEFGMDEFLELPYSLREDRLERDAHELGLQKEQYRRILLWWQGDNRRMLLTVRSEG